MDKLGSIRKEYLQQDPFRMILKETLSYYPEPKGFNPGNPEQTIDAQIEEWKAKSAEQRGFELCFKLITGFYPKDFRK